jgi:hypothetical protein
MLSIRAASVLFLLSKLISTQSLLFIGFYIYDDDNKSDII